MDKKRRTVKKNWGNNKNVGVYWNEARQRFIAQIYFDGKQRYLGGFVSEDMAANAYQKALKKYWETKQTKP